MLLVFLNRANEGLAVCRMAVMAPTNITCTTTTAEGFLIWRNSSGAGFSFRESTSVSVGTTGTLGSTIMTLDNIEHVSNAVVYTSTASENMIEDTTIQCSDGGAPQSIDITVKSTYEQELIIPRIHTTSNGAMVMHVQCTSCILTALVTIKMKFTNCLDIEKHVG